MSHEARLEVYPRCLAENARVVVELVAPSGLIAVVKSEAYGHGALLAATAFLGAGAVGLAVSTVPEAVALRREGITAPILTLTEPRAEDVADVAEFQVGATIFTETRLVEIAMAAKEEGGLAPVHIKLDTGTRRAGCLPDDLPMLVARAEMLEHVSLQSVWSQFAAASELVQTDTAVSALSMFKQVVADVELPPHVRTHIANSAAAISMPGSRMDAVRSGIALYGYSGGNNQAVSRGLGLKPALRVVAGVRSVRQVQAGSWAGYGEPRLLESDTAIASVGIGYAHGIPRSWGLAGGWVSIKGNRYPLLGPVSMEQMLIDLGDPRVSRVVPGDEVVVLGDGAVGPDAADIAAACGTIPNEILCRVGMSRLPRAYVQ